MASLEQLIELARKTGDRLIIHDPYGDKDLVVMDIVQYKALLRGRVSVADMSEKEFVKKMNRDLAVWESNQDEEDLEPQMEDEQWHSISDVFSQQEAPLSEDQYDPPSFVADELQSYTPVTAFQADQQPIIQEPLPGQQTERVRTQFAELLYEFDESSSGQVKQANLKDPLFDDEPIFFEEPIS